MFVSPHKANVTSISFWNISTIALTPSYPLALKPYKYGLPTKTALAPNALAFIKSALAPAREDSDWAKSVKVISPFCNLALSDSTCLSN